MQGTSSYHGSKKWTPWGGADSPDIDTADATKEFHWPVNVDVYRIAVTPTTAVANAAGTVSIEVYRNNDYGDAGEDTLLGTFILTDTTTVAAGEIVYGVLQGADTDGETAEDSTTRYVAPSGPYSIGVGQGLVLKVAAEADSGAVEVAVEYIERDVSNIVANETNLTRVYTVPAV